MNHKMEEEVSPSVLEQLSEHIMQINDILALMDNEQCEADEDSLSDVLQSSLSSPINAHLIHDLIQDSAQDSDPSSPDLSAEDPEWQTRKTLQTLAQLAELVDQGNVNNEQRKSCENNAQSPQKAADSQDSSEIRNKTDNFKPSNPVLLISKVCGALSRKRKAQQMLTAKPHKVLNSVKQPPQETAKSASNQGLFLVPCSNGTYMPVMLLNGSQVSHQVTDSQVTPPGSSIQQTEDKTSINMAQASNLKQSVQCKDNIVSMNLHPVVVIPTEAVTRTSGALSHPSGDSLESAQAESGDSQEVDDLDKAVDSVKEFYCQYCAAAFNRRVNLEKHLLIHKVFFSDEDIYKCPNCEKTFLQNCDLQRHLHVHSGTEPYRCQLCQKGYIRKTDLLVHMRFHKQEKPFVCQICSRGFAQTGDLRRHTRLVHEKASKINCGHCKRKYVSEATLIQHMKAAHKDVILESLAQQQQN